MTDSSPEAEAAAACRAIVAAAQRLDALGLNVNSSGNVSVRLPTGELLVTPSGIPAERLMAEQIVALAPDGTPTAAGQLAPTSEWQLHASIYAARPDVGAIVHTHSPEATAAATLARSVPAVHYVVARFNTTELRCAPYATYGTAALAEAVVTTLGHDATACLMANHGAIAVGPDLDRALALALDVEWLCGVYRRAVALGTPQQLPAEEIARVNAKFATYGQAE